MPTHMPYRRPRNIVLPIVIALLILAFVMVMAVRVAHLTPPSNPYAALASNPRLPDTFRFEPKPDITPYELALAFAPMFGTVDYIERMRPFYDAMPPEAKRHWLPPLPHDHQH